ncbi:MAG: amino acid racemase [Chloroflexi bacterium]|nr:amino acid racemase [Chloroflexota bacterium]
MAKRIGILGGISHESTAAYYTLLHQKYNEMYGDYYYPEIVVYSLNFQKFTDMEDRDQTEEYIDYIASGITGLYRAGADFAVMAANSPHAVYPELAKCSPIPMVSIVDVTIQRAKSLGLKKCLLLGIKFTMQKNFYGAIARNHGIKVCVPSLADQVLVNAIIFDELVLGSVTQESKRQLLMVISAYEVDGVILGCTELPLILHAEDSELPLLDTLELHVQAALDYSLT